MKIFANGTSLFIPEFFGISIEVYFIILILGIPTFLFWRWTLKKFIKANRIRIIATWIATIILTPIIYVGIVLLFILMISYYPSHEFDRNKWFANKEKRYESSKDLIKSKVLLGKTKLEVVMLLGDGAVYHNDSNIMVYELGYRPGLFSIDPDFLEIELENGKVLKVEQHGR